MGKEIYLESKKESYSLSELEEKVRKFRDELFSKEDEMYDKKGNNEAGNFFEELRKMKRSLTEGFINELKKEKDRFKHIFETEKGSIYFVTENGESLRFKNDGKEIKDQPILKKIFFIEEAMSTEISQARASMETDYYVLNNKIKICNFRVGACPLEFWMASDSNEVVYQEDGKNLEILGIKRENGEEERAFYGGFHIGHKINNIIK
jgi:hypothetical protein